MDAANAYAERMESHKKELSIQAKAAVFETFPAKILSLGETIESFKSITSPFHPSNPTTIPDLTILTLPSHIPTERVQSPSEKANGIVDGETKETTKGEDDDEHEEMSLRTGLKTNPVYKTIGEMLGKEGEDVLAVCMALRMWLFTVTPAVEEGNNTGVEIQEMALSSLNSLHNLGSDCCNYLTTARQNRAALARQYLRAPGIEDRGLALEEGDKVEVFGARQLVMLLQSKYLEVMGIFQRNWGKICEPKGQRDTWH